MNYIAAKNLQNKEQVRVVNDPRLSSSADNSNRQGLTQNDFAKTLVSMLRSFAVNGQQYLGNYRTLGKSAKYNCIDRNEGEFSGLSKMDDIRRVFFWQGQVLRAINEDSVERVKSIFSCGMIDELVHENLFPKSWVADYIMDGYSLIVEHERIHPIKYPYEWSFSMLKDGAITILRVQAINRKYGYQLTNCHG